MVITRLRLQNWRNFRSVDVRLRDRTFLIGANASGKSNLLDAFRFLRDVCKPQGGGLQKAIADRGGLQKLRCLHARRPPEVRIEIEVDDGAWAYTLAFKPEGKGAQRTLITGEQVVADGKTILSRPDREDRKDPLRLTQTSLEQIQANASFRELTDFLAKITYLHVVPQLLKHGEQIGGQRLENDPFGQGFLERIARATEHVRLSRLEKIEKALTIAVPQFQQLRFVKDEITGRPHLEARYAHHRPNAGWQREDHFSDGTLRLLGLLWVLLEGDSLLLLEEPELSLNDAIIRQVPELISNAVGRRRSRQVIISTHSEALLDNASIDARGVLLLEPSPEGTQVRSITKAEKELIQDGLTVADVVLVKTKPGSVEQLALWP